MEFQEIVNLLDNQPSKFKTKIELKQMMNHKEHITEIN